MNRRQYFFHSSYIAILLLLFIFISVPSTAQRVIGIGTKYNDTFREWIITTEDEDIVGELRMRWEMRDDWTEWDVRIGDKAFTIEQRWRDDPNLWEIRGEGAVVHAKTVWPNEFNRWKITDGTNQFTWATQYANIRDSWRLDGTRKSGMKMYQYWEGDPREWIVIDDLPSDVSDATSLAMIFIALHFSTPHL